MTTPAQGGSGSVVPISSAASWQTQAANQYSLFDFYTATKDSRGESDVQRVKIPAWMAVKMQEVIAERQWPSYRTIHDVVRDALRHRLQWLDDNLTNPLLQARLAQALREWDLEQRTTDLERKITFANQMIERTEQVAAACEKFGCYDTLREHVGHVRDAVDDWEGNIRKDMMTICDRYENKCDAADEALRLTRSRKVSQ